MDSNKDSNKQSFNLKDLIDEKEINKYKKEQNIISEEEKKKKL